MNREAEINIKVALDDKNFPEKIIWNAEDSGIKDNDAEAMILALWDKKERNTLSIDLWTKEMVVEDMNILYFQVMQKMADTYYNATKNTDAANMIKEFSMKFAEKLELLKNDNSQG